MPTYEYKCSECDATFDAICSVGSRKTTKECPSCSGQGVFIVSAPHIGAWLDSDRWVKNRESHMKQERKNMDNHGTYK